MSRKINGEIAWTYITTNKKLTMVAALGVLLGMSIFIFMNSLMAGFDRKSNEGIFKTIPHLRVYNDDVLSQPLSGASDASTLIVNPKVVPTLSRIENPNALIDVLRREADVTVVMPQVNVSVFYNNGASQLAGSSVGVWPEESDKMFSLSSLIVEGRLSDLNSHANGILIGSGIAEKMSLRVGDNMSLTSSKGVTKVMQVVGIFQTNNSREDKIKSYVNLSAAQQLLKQNTTYITDINVNVRDPEQAPQYAAYLTELTGYKAEDWKAANETVMAASRMRTVIARFVSSTILLVAGFGIYNILNMTITQKMNDIAILKAMGFEGGDVIRIFVTQALIIGFLGIIFGVLAAVVLVRLLQNVWIGGDIGYFPIQYEPIKFIQGIAFGFVITFFAGYIPARKAARVDPVSILRK